jgi:hypothetical protein
MTLTFHSQNGLHVTLEPWEKIWSFRGDLRIKSERVRSAWLGMPKSVWNEWKIPGSFVPGLIKAGTFFTPRGREFWYVTRKKCHAVTIELKGCKKYDRLVLGFETPEAMTSSGLTLSAPPGTIEIQPNT